MNRPMKTDETELKIFPHPRGNHKMQIPLGSQGIKNLDDAFINPYGLFLSSSPLPCGWSPL